jgi:hypothetical protein
MPRPVRRRRRAQAELLPPPSTVALDATDLFDYALQDTQQKHIEPIFALISTIEGVSHRKALQNKQ